ncbi:16S rRNA processing protein RimM [Halobacteriovorax marinus]|uniref:Ribosome maturation factor RimM n=1 Tax=Halobacteriovorax marinus TaxID=97084 RepID=A0A1Y5F3P9_9BACT|nr:16S rRNA processing protein RimM [Halobacteriovorax marinus]
MKKNELIELGVCGKPHGIKGGFTFVLNNAEDSVLANGSEITLFPSSKASSIEEGGEDFHIKSIAFGNKVIVYLKEVSDRNLVESMIPFTIKMSRENFPEAEEGEFYYSDLIGLEVRDVTTSEVVGKVSDFYDNTAQVVLVIKSPGKEVLELPFVENFFPEVDIENGFMTFIRPEYVEGKKTDD